MARYRRLVVAQYAAVSNVSLATNPIVIEGGDGITYESRTNHNLQESDTNLRDVSWSRDGNYFAYTKLNQGTINTKLKTFTHKRLNGLVPEPWGTFDSNSTLGGITSPTQASTVGVYYNPAWSPNSQYLSAQYTFTEANLIITNRLGLYWNNFGNITYLTDISRSPGGIGDPTVWNSAGNIIFTANNSQTANGRLGLNAYTVSSNSLSVLGSIIDSGATGNISAIAFNSSGTRLLTANTGWTINSTNTIDGNINIFDTNTIPYVQKSITWISGAPTRATAPNGIGNAVWLNNGQSIALLFAGNANNWPTGSTVQSSVRIYEFFETNTALVWTGNVSWTANGTPSARTLQSGINKNGNTLVIGGTITSKDGLIDLPSTVKVYVPDANNRYSEQANVALSYFPQDIAVFEYVVEQANALLSSTCINSLAAANRVRTIDYAIDTVYVQSDYWDQAYGGVTFNANASLSAAFGTDDYFQADYILNGYTIGPPSAEKFPGTRVFINSAFSVAPIDGRIIQTATSALSSAVTVAPIDGRIIQKGQSYQTSSGTVAVTGTTIKRTSSAISSAFDQTVSAQRFCSSNVNLNCVSTQTTVADKLKIIGANLISSFGIVSQPNKIVASSASLDSIGFANIFAQATLSDSVDLVSTTTLDAQAKRYRESAVALVTQANLSCQGTIPVVFRTNAHVSSSFTQSTNARRFRSQSPALTSNSSIRINGGKLAVGTAGLQAFDFVLSIAKIIHISNTLQYRVLYEDRLFNVPTDITTLDVPFEDRVNMVSQEQRSLDVAAEDRELDASL